MSAFSHLYWSARRWKEKANRTAIGTYGRFVLRSVEHQGVRLVIADECFDHNTRYHIIRGSYERSESDLIESYLRPDQPVIELGGGFGFVSCRIAHVLDQGTRQITVEPDPTLRDLIRLHKELNGCDFVVDGSLYEPSGDSRTFYISNKRAGNSVYRPSQVDEQITPETTTLAQLRDQYTVEEFQLVVDIEGSEFDLIRSEPDLLSTACSRIIIEFHDHTSDSIPEHVTQLESLGFSVRDRIGNCIILENDTP